MMSAEATSKGKGVTLPFCRLPNRQLFLKRILFLHGAFAKTTCDLQLTATRTATPSTYFFAKAM